MLVAMAAGLFLLAGVSMSYVAIKSTVLQTQELAHAQEVIRYTSRVFTRSTKQAIAPPTVSADALTVTFSQAPNVLSCLGTVPAAAYTEIYTLSNGFITCDIGNGLGAVNLLRGVSELRFSQNGFLLSVTVKPNNMPNHFGNGLTIDIAASRLILEQAYGGV